MPESTKLRELTAADLAGEQRNGTLILDARPAEQFAAIHILGSIQISLLGHFASWAAILLDPAQKLLQVRRWEPFFLGSRLICHRKQLNHSKSENMSAQSDRPVRPRRLGRSILAVVAGIAAGIALSVGTDWGLHVIGVLPGQNERWPNQLLLLAAVYRSIYGVIAGYVIAQLAPNRPMGHSLFAGGLGMLVSTLGAVTAWSSTVGQHWYAITLALTAIPTAWIGAKLRLMQFRTEATAAHAAEAK